ncbi:MAG: ribosome recycling factor, partial [Clostridia bacterium]
MAYESIKVVGLFDEYEERLEKGVNSLKNEFNNLKAGRANPYILDKVMVDYYGVETPIKQVGNISVPESRVILISV